MWAQTLRFLKRIICLPEERISRICLASLAETDDQTEEKYNWFTQVKNGLAAMGIDMSWPLPDKWEQEWLDIIASYFLNQDKRKVMDSPTNGFYTRMMTADTLSPAPHLLSSLPLSNKRILTQIRLKSRFLNIGKKFCLLHPEGNCQACNRKAEDSIFHFLCECPIYSAPILRNRNISQDTFLNLLTVEDEPIWTEICNSAISSIASRSFLSELMEEGNEEASVTT